MKKIVIGIVGLFFVVVTIGFVKILKSHEERVPLELSATENFRVIFMKDPPRTAAELADMKSTVNYSIDFLIECSKMSLQEWNEKLYPVDEATWRQIRVYGVYPSLARACDSSLYFGFRHPYCVNSTNLHASIGHLSWEVGGLE